MSTRINIHSFFDEPTSTVSYILWEKQKSQAVIIDPVLDYDHPSGKFSTASADVLLAFLNDHQLSLQWILETHAHADHLSSAPYLKQKTGAPVAIGEHIRDVQTLFRPVFNLNDLSGDGSEFDHLLKDGERIPFGETFIQVLHTPGHTPACVSYYVEGNLFVGDTLFMPDYGTARADFPGGSADALYISIQRLLAFPDETTIHLCHDYKAPGREEHCWTTTVAEQRAHNIHVHEGITKEHFVSMRNARDAQLPAPRLLLPSIQVNIKAGQLPSAESNGVRYLKIPIREQSMTEVR
jgi:Zn-dependent hydrolases, including glyoxylases